MRRFITRTIALALLVAAFPLAAADLKDDMVALDRAYIPALAVTNRSPAPDEARRAMALLESQWAAFRDNHGRPGTGDAQWAADLDRIGGFIAAAGKIVAESRDFARAHEELEGVRLTLLAARARMKIPYYLDHLTRFHEVMEEIHHAAAGKTEATFSEADAQAIKTRFTEAERLWNIVRAAQVDPAFRLTGQQQNRLMELVASETRAVEALNEAQRAGDRSVLIKAAQGLRGPFSQIYGSLGDFAALGAKPGR